MVVLPTYAPIPPDGIVRLLLVKASRVLERRELTGFMGEAPSVAPSVAHVRVYGCDWHACGHGRDGRACVGADLCALCCGRASMTVAVNVRS